MASTQLANSIRVSMRFGLTFFAFVTVISNEFIQLSPVLRELMETPTVYYNQHYNNPTSAKCAINLYGLPRSFRRLVLPSFVEHVVKPNLKYNCDYFVHYHAVTKEAPGRSGYGGTIDPNQIFDLEAAVREVVALARSNSTHPEAIRMPIVAFASSTEEEFQTLYRNYTDVIETEKVANGALLYLPSRASSYTKETVVNIFKMWHSQQAVWNLMEEHSRNYEQVGMFRADVFYVTDIDIFSNGRQNNQIHDVQEPNNGRNAQQNRSAVAVVPSFAKGPVNDRFICGPYAAVKIWAAGRFQRMDHHLHVTIPRKAPGFALHSERYLSLTIFPAIETETGTPIIEDRTICFLRARVDGTIWVNDCGGKAERWKREIERILQRDCSEVHRLEATEKATVKANVKIISC